MVSRRLALEWIGMFEGPTGLSLSVLLPYQHQHGSLSVSILKAIRAGVGRVWERDYTQNENGTIAMVLDSSDIYLFIMILDPLPFLTKRPVSWENG